MLHRRLRVGFAALVLGLCLGMVGTAALLHSSGPASADDDDGKAPSPEPKPLYRGDVAIDRDDVKLGRRHYSPFVDQSFPNRVFWGDTHLHTSYSTDAGMLGNTLGPNEAFRFARGEKVRASLGHFAQLVRPLDFLVVADHAENLGLAPMIAESNPQLLANPWGREIHDLVRKGDQIGAFVKWGEGMMANKDPLADKDLTRTFWNRIVQSAERYNEPGVFTALHGFEWTSGKNANNLHRVVVFRDDADKVADLVPFSNYDSADPEDLWTWLEAYERRTGGKVMAFAHNGNLSNGLMFNDVRENGEAGLDAAYAERQHALGTALRGHTDQGRRRNPPDALARTTSLRITTGGTAATSAPSSRSRTCFRGSMPVRHSRVASRTRRGSGSIPSSSG